MDFGWKKKAERLRMTLLSAGHQMAKDLPPIIVKTLALYSSLHKSGNVSRDETPEMARLKEEIEQLHRESPDAPRPIWEPVEIYGWKIEATFYLQDGKLWWLVHALRHTEKPPSDKEVAFINKVVDHLGADPKRDMIIGPSSRTGDAPLPFGWWTWINQAPLYEIQVNRDKKKDKEKIRIVPLGARETDGYSSLDRVAPLDLDRQR